MGRMTGGAAIVAALKANGVDTVFGLPGAQMYPLFDALHGESNGIRTVGARHEQGVAFMAFGYAKSTGRPGVYSVVPGPGVLNSTAALCTAWGCNAPVLCLTGQVPSEFLGRGRGHLHELPDQLATLRSLVKSAERIEQAHDAPRIVADAFRHMTSGRPGPASVEMPWDVMAGSAEVPDPVAAESDAPPAPDPETLDRAAALLANASHPMIMVGGGAQHAAAEILALAEVLDAPVAAFRSGRGIVAEDHELGINSAVAHALWPETDALVGIGTRLELPYMRWTGMMTVTDRPAAPPQLIRIDIDPLEMVRLKPHVGIVADSAAGATALAEAIARIRKTKIAGRDRIRAAKAKTAKAIQKIQPQMSYLGVIRDVLPRDGFFVEELCQVGFASYYGFPVYEPRTYVTPGFQGTLGFGFQTALGVKVANPTKAVVSVAGDGGFMFCVQELATAVQYGIGVVVIVFNNKAFGNVRRDQQTAFAGHVIGADFVNPDFVKLAESFGAAGHRVDSPEALRPVLERAIANDAPALIEVAIEPDSEASPWEFIHPKPL